MTIRSLFIAALFLMSTASIAQAPVAESNEKKVWDEAKLAATSGPSAISVAGQANLNLPANYVYVPQPHATKVLNVMGNPGTHPNLIGLIFPNGNDDWFITLRFEASGYIKDGDAKEWNADEMLDSFRKGTEAMNEERLKAGVPALEIVGWAEKPAYDATTQRLIWAMTSKNKGAAAGQPQGVNYNTYALGREGYFSMNLVTGLDQLAAYKGEAKTMLAALNYTDGKKYADFNSSTDKVAEYGLAALVLGVAAKKLGFFAMAALFFAKFAKVSILAGLGLVAGVYKYLGRKKGVVKAPPPEQSIEKAAPPDQSKSS
jgi:uncharacterized membrane-anchored protein